MKRLAPILVLAIAGIGCKQSPTPSKVQRVSDLQAVLPADPLLASVVGKWGQESSALVTITLLPDGQGLLEIPKPGEGWHIKIKNAHIDNGKIVYDQIYEVRDVPNHPMDGARSTVMFEPIASSHNRAKLTSKSADSDTVVAILSRLE